MPIAYIVGYAKSKSEGFPKFPNPSTVLGCSSKMMGLYLEEGTAHA